MSEATEKTQAPSAKPAPQAAPAQSAAPAKAAEVATKQRPKAAPKPKPDPASLIPADKLVKYQTTDERFMLPVKCGDKFVFVRSDKPYPFDKSKLKHQMLLTINAEIAAKRLQEVV